MKLKNLWVVAMIISSLLLLASFSVEAADKTITDGIKDVSSVSFTGETTVITSSPDIEVDNIDLTQATYTKQGIQVILTLQVRGNIENRGKIIDLLGENPLDYNTAEYEFQLTTSEQDYTVSYTNLTGQLTKGDELINLTSSDFSVADDTLTVSFSLISAEETIENLSVVSTFIKFNMSGMTGMDTDDLDPSAFVYLSDIAPNPALMVYEAYAANIGSVGETIQFNGSVQPLTGQPPYTYHWDFGDQATSTALNPTHIYTKAGEFTYTFTITDHANDSASETGTITISTEGGSNGSSSSPMLLFLAILIIIIVIGVIIIVWIIRR